MTTVLDRDRRSKRPLTVPQVAVEPSWLTWIPAEGVMGVVSLAFDEAPAFWEATFGVADQVERVDPARARVAPLRSRVNLLAAAVGARPEVDLWPRLRGVTACVMNDVDQTGRPAGAILILHTDANSSAEHLANDVLPRLGSLLNGKKPATEPSRRAIAGASLSIGTVGGRSLRVTHRGRDVVVGWGEHALSAAQAAAARPERSAASLCAGWQRAGKRPPQRVGAVWPSRCWPLCRGIDLTAPAGQVLTEGPPAVWWGWTGSNEAVDSVHYADLRILMRNFLEKLPLDPSPLH